MRKHYENSYTKHYKFSFTRHYAALLLLFIFLAFWTTNASAALDPCDVTLGTYDETKTFIDSNTGSKCYIQPDGTVFIIPWGTGNYGTLDNGDIDMTIDTRTDDQKSHFVGEVTIPDKVNNPNEDNKEYTVSGLARRSMRRLVNMTKLILPESIKIIDSYCLQSSYNDKYQLLEVDAPGVETVGYCAFDSETELATLNMPKVRTLYGWAFHQCPGLISVSFPELEETFPKQDDLTMQPTHYNGPFWACRNLETVDFPKLKNAAAGMFYECQKLKELSLPEVETTGYRFIYQTGLQKLDLPKCKVLYTEHSSSWGSLNDINVPNLERISPYGFCGSRIETLAFPHLKGFTYAKNTNTDGHGFLALPNIKVINLPEFTEDISSDDINSGSSIVGSELRELRIPKVTSMTDINYPPFMSNIKVLDIRGVKNIIVQEGSHDYAYFSTSIDTLYCNNVNIPREFNSERYENYDIKSYHNDADDYPSMKYVYIANQTEEINDSVFEHIPHIQTLVFGPDCDTKTINGVALSEVPDLQEVSIEGKNTDNVSVDGVVYSSDGKTLVAYPRANEGSTNADGQTRAWQLTDEKMSTLTHIAKGALRNYGKVHELQFGNALTAIDRKAFENSHIDRVVIAGDAPLTTIGDDAFRNMTETNFRYLMMPKALTSIGSGAFYGDTQLQALELPCDGLTTIGDNAFAGQTAITSISLPNSVTTIGANAFNGNTAMEYFTIPTSCTSIGANAFDGCTALTMVNAPAATPVASVKDAFPESFKTNTKLFVTAENKDNYNDWSDSFSDIITSQSVTGIKRGQFYTFSRSYPVNLNNATTGYQFNGLRIYQATGVTAENKPEGYIGLVTLKLLTGEALASIPANTPLIIFAPSIEGGSDLNFDYAISSTTPSSLQSPVKGTPAAIRLDQQDDNGLTSYILVHPEDGDYKSGEFHRVKGSEWNEVATRKGQQAYLQVSDAIAATAKTFRFALTRGTTGIGAITTAPTADNDKWYNLQGQETSNPRHGVYIHGNKKVVVR